MKQYPSFLKFKKYHKLTKFNLIFNKEKKNFFINNGNYALKSLEQSKIKYKNIEACRKAIKRSIKKQGKIWIKIFTNIPIYKKSLASRMGKGKGNLSHWIALIKKGSILFEISGISEKKAMYILEKSKSKLPFKSKIIRNIF